MRRWLGSGLILVRCAVVGVPGREAAGVDAYPRTASAPAASCLVTPDGLSRGHRNSRPVFGLSPRFGRLVTIALPPGIVRTA